MFCIPGSRTHREIGTIVLVIFVNGFSCRPVYINRFGAFISPVHLASWNFSKTYPPIGVYFSAYEIIFLHRSYVDQVCRWLLAVCFGVVPRVWSRREKITRTLKKFPVRRTVLCWPNREEYFLNCQNSFMWAFLGHTFFPIKLSAFCFINNQFDIAWCGYLSMCSEILRNCEKSSWRSLAMYSYNCRRVVSCVSSFASKKIIRLHINLFCRVLVWAFHSNKHDVRPLIKEYQSKSIRRFKDTFTRTSNLLLGVSKIYFMVPYCQSNIATYIMCMQLTI